MCVLYLAYPPMFTLKTGTVNHHIKIQQTCIFGIIKCKIFLSTGKINLYDRQCLSSECIDGHAKHSTLMKLEKSFSLYNLTNLLSFSNLKR